MNSMPIDLEKLQQISLFAELSLEDLEQVAAMILERSNTLIDILVNNAGILTSKPIEQVKEQDFDREFAINVI